IRTGKLKETKDILMQYLDNISIDGRIPNRMPASSLGCADGVGWVFKRLRDLVETARQQKRLEKLFTSADMEKISKRLTVSLARIERMFQQDGLIRNNPLETWMDTRWQHLDGREGFCIEIQCQYLNMLRFAYELTHDEKYKRSMERMSLVVKNAFFNGKLLADRKDDFTQRPNIFIAYYHYPELLSRMEWETAFASALPKLWLPWGGLSSIDTSHHLFTDHHTGASNQSYHRGDTWYWINNLAALCLWRNNPIRFEREIALISEASAKEILWSGSLGDHAEVGDAKELSSKGCLSQAWSAAFFIELMLEVYER
ncbi:TPA: hypothetical protein HA265_07570, partial [Candidatus Woesearchaeota archaeon]|nr:hypothetical protein [Candidatus Woesearchaeota archaeon]